MASTAEQELNAMGDNDNQTDIYQNGINSPLSPGQSGAGDIGTQDNSRTSEVQVVPEHDNPNTDEIVVKATNIKEHDAIQEEIQQADRIEEEHNQEVAENDGWATNEIGVKATNVKEHDAIQEEIQQADRIEEQHNQEVAENDGWATSEIAVKATNVKEHDAIQEEIQQADRIEEELNQEVAENDGWVQILGNDQLSKKVLRQGLANTRPLRGEICKINIKGSLKDTESLFESEEDFTVQLGDAELITGLDLAVPLMCKGEISMISISPRFGYGAKGNPPLVPPNAWLLYTIELISFEQEKELNELSVLQRRDIGNAKRERGNWWYGRGDSTLAVQCYRRALEFLDETNIEAPLPDGNENEGSADDQEELKLLFDDRLKAYNNMAAAQLHLQSYGPALKSVEAVLKCQPKNVKALFRKGKILAAKGDTDEALSTLREANRLEPSNKAVIQELGKLSAKRKTEKQNEKLLYKRMFNNNSNSSSEDNSNSETGSGFERSTSLALIVGGVLVAIAGLMAYRYAS